MLEGLLCRSLSSFDMTNNKNVVSVPHGMTTRENIRNLMSRNNDLLV